MLMMRNKTWIAIFAVLLVVGGFVYLTSQTSEIPRVTETQQEEVETSVVTNGEISCSGEATPALTEGPYYKAGSPERDNIAQGQIGEELVVEGYVLSTECEPISGAWIDFWQAGADGNYDNIGFNLRGHQYTDQMGRYRLETVMPARYSGRTAHIHVKVRANENSSVLTTQLFFPDPPAGGQNQSDSIFNEALVVDMQEAEEGNVASFNFILPK